MAKQQHNNILISKNVSNWHNHAIWLDNFNRFKLFNRMIEQKQLIGTRHVILISRYYDWKTSNLKRNIVSNAMHFECSKTVDIKIAITIHHPVRMNKFILFSPRVKYQYPLQHFHPKYQKLALNTLNWKKKQCHLYFKRTRNNAPCSKWISRKLVYCSIFYFIDNR